MRSLPRHRFLATPITDIASAVALAGLAFVPTLSVIGAQIADLPKRPVDGWGVLLVLAQCLPLVLRTRRPALCLALVAAGFALHQAMAYPQTFASVGLYLALYSAGAHLNRHRRTTAATSTVAYAGLAVALYLLGSPNRAQDFLAYFLVLVVVWLAGTGIRRWRSDELERRRLSARLATTTERARIARELHDVVTHHVTAIVVQADAAQFLVDSAPDRATQGLVTISTTGRRALTELRQLLGVLEATGESDTTDRNPALRRLADLVE
ncbi:MAG: sensor histidine kinase, partial [Stackebrandtia sp.]